MRRSRSPARWCSAAAARYRCHRAGTIRLLLPPPFSQCKHDQCRQARGNGERRHAQARRQHQQYRHGHDFSLGQRRARCTYGAFAAARCRSLDRPQFRHPVREWLQQCGPDHQRRRGHVAALPRSATARSLSRRRAAKMWLVPGQRERRACPERAGQRLCGQGVRIRLRQFCALGPRSVHRLRRCQLCWRNVHLHLGKSIQYQWHAHRRQWRQFGERASRRQLQMQGISRAPTTAVATSGSRIPGRRRQASILGF